MLFYEDITKSLFWNQTLISKRSYIYIYIYDIYDIGLGRIGNRWGVVMVILISYLYCVNVIWLIRYCNKWWSVRGRYDKYTMLRPINCGSAWRRIWGLMEEVGTYVATDVMVDGGKQYLWCFRCGMVSFAFCFSKILSKCRHENKHLSNFKQYT